MPPTALVSQESTITHFLTGQNKISKTDFVVRCTGYPDDGFAAVITELKDTRSNEEVNIYNHALI